MALPQRPAPQTVPQNGEQFGGGYHADELPPPEAYDDPYPSDDYYDDQRFAAQHAAPVARQQDVGSRQSSTQSAQQQTRYVEEQQYQAREPVYQPPAKQAQENRQKDNRTSDKGSNEFKAVPVDGFYDYEGNDQLVTEWYSADKHGQVLKGEIIEFDLISGGQHELKDGRTHCVRFTVRSDSGAKFFVSNESRTYKEFFSALRPQKGEFMWMEVVVMQGPGKRGEYKGYIYDPDTNEMIRATGHYGMVTTPVHSSYQQPQNAQHMQPAASGGNYRQEQYNAETGNGYRPQAYTPPTPNRR